MAELNFDGLLGNLFGGGGDSELEILRMNEINNINLKDEDIILRSGKAKSIGLRNANGSTFPYENPKRAFIQLSNLETTTSEKTLKKLIKAEQTDANLVYLVESLKYLL